MLDGLGKIVNIDNMIKLKEEALKKPDNSKP
jgi:hypothetical protein